MDVNLQPVGATRRVDHVFEQLRSRILSGELAAGEQLPNERSLADRLAVNRSSVREAVKRLEFLELVEVRHGSGTFVRDLGQSAALQLVESLLREPSTITCDLLEQLLLFRRQISLQVVALAATNHTADQLARARELLDREQAGIDRPEEALAVDVEMNCLLGEATGNLMYQLVTNLFTRLIRRLGPLYYNERRDHSRSLETHRRMLDALERRDADGACAVLAEMLEYSEGAILREAEKLEAAGRIGPGAVGSAS